jgi:hypothetical protein
MALKEVMQDINIKRRREFMSTTIGPYDRYPLTSNFALEVTSPTAISSLAGNKRYSYLFSKPH